MMYLISTGRSRKLIVSGLCGDICLLIVVGDMLGMGRESVFACVVVGGKKREGK